MRVTFSTDRVSLASVYMRKKVDPFAQDNSANACSDRLTYLHRVDQFGRGKVFNGGKLALLRE